MDPVMVVEHKARIVNPLGLHARPAAEFVKVASRFRAEITLTRDDQSVNGKSIMGVMTLAAECGTELVIRADGEDAEGAVAALVDLVSNGFNEQ